MDTRREKSHEGKDWLWRSERRRIWSKETMREWGRSSEEEENCVDLQFLSLSFLDSSLLSSSFQEDHLHFFDTNSGCWFPSQSKLIPILLFFPFRWIAWLFTFSLLFRIHRVHSWGDGELPFLFFFLSSFLSSFSWKSLILANDLNTITWAYNKKKFTIRIHVSFLRSFLPYSSLLHPSEYECTPCVTRTE